MEDHFARKTEELAMNVKGKKTAIQIKYIGNTTLVLRKWMFYDRRSMYAVRYMSLSMTL